MSLTKKEHYRLARKVEDEDFGYYMLSYGPDWTAISKLGFDVLEVKKACDLLEELQYAILEGLEYAGDEEE